MRVPRMFVAAIAATIVAALPLVIVRAQRGAAALPPVVVVETEHGVFAFETFPKEAPQSVKHIVDLARAGFYDGQRIHRALPGFLVQFGDPQTRDLTTRERWGRGPAASSGTPVSLPEISERRRHQAGAVGLAHMGDPAQGDSQIYVTLAARPDLDGKYAVFARVIEGEDVPGRLRVGDEIRRVYVRE
jgi:peptidyl-prolyl cis-trans isomerase B (cyclophilin B)